VVTSVMAVCRPVTIIGIRSIRDLILATVPEGGSTIDYREHADC